jgi:class 3 adenylate cyclase
LIEKKLGLSISSLTGSDLLEVKVALDRTSGELAFGERSASDNLHSQLLWHFGPWRLRKLVERHDSDASMILPPSHYDNVVILMADLSSYTNYVRDTKHQEVIRHALTSFCTKARHEILNTGGMLYQYIGDEVVGLYGIPDYQSGYPQEALEAAKSLIDVGKSVSSHWQSQLDRIQSAKGVHIGMAIGDLHVVSNRPFGRAHFSVVGDAVNVAARLRQHAQSGEIVVSNSYFRALDQDSGTQFEKLEPIEARNLGRIQAWKLNA